MWSYPCNTPAPTLLCGLAKWRFHTEPSLPLRDCRLPPSKPSNLLCSFQWPHQLCCGLPSSEPAVALPGGGFAQNLPYHCKTAVCPPQNPRTFSAASSSLTSCRLPSCGLPALALPGGGFAQLRDCRLPLQSPQTFSAASSRLASCGLPSSEPAMQAAASRRTFLTVAGLPFAPLKTLEPSLQLPVASPAVAMPAVASPALSQLWPRQLAASRRTFLTVARLYEFMPYMVLFPSTSNHKIIRGRRHQGASPFYKPAHPMPQKLGPVQALDVVPKTGKIPKTLL